MYFPTGSNPDLQLALRMNCRVSDAAAFLGHSRLAKADEIIILLTSNLQKSVTVCLGIENSDNKIILVDIKIRVTNIIHDLCILSCDILCPY